MLRAINRFWGTAASGRVTLKSIRSLFLTAHSALGKEIYVCWALMGFKLKCNQKQKACLHVIKSTAVVAHHVQAVRTVNFSRRKIEKSFWAV